MTYGPHPALTIYTDASWTAEGGVGSWGAVIAGAETNLELSGAFTAPCYDATQGELFAIANALHVVIRDKLAPPGSFVEVHTDSLSSVQVLNKRGQFRRHRREQFAPALDKLRELVRRTGWRVRFVWIKGHQHNPDCRHAIGNQRADKLARAANPVVRSAEEKARDRRARRRAKDKARRARRRAERAAAPAWIETAAPARAREGADA